jgi:tRNA(Ile2) C34 agmatinyltransferase TiaS
MTYPDFPGAALDRWLTTDPRDSEPTCPECGEPMEDDDSGGWECPACEWFHPGPDPDRARDEMLEREWDDGLSKLDG